MHSIFYDLDFEDVSFLLFTKLYSTLDTENYLLSILYFYIRWQAFYFSQIIHSTVEKTAYTPFYSMIWIAKDQKIQQVLIYHLDITALLLFYLKQ